MGCVQSCSVSIPSNQNQEVERKGKTKCFSCFENQETDNIEFNKYLDICVSDCIKFIPPIQKSYCISVYDGDTITIVKQFSCDGEPPKYYKYSVRLYGIDTPELRTKNAVEKKYAIMAKNAVIELILNKMVELEDISYDKYGRILAKVFVTDERGFKINISEKLVEMRLAKRYYGKTKEVTDWEQYYNM